MARNLEEEVNLVDLHEGFWSADLEPELKTEYLQRIGSALDRLRSLSYRGLTQDVDVPRESSVDPMKIAEVLGFAAYAYGDVDDPHKLWAKVFNLLLSGMAYEIAESPSSAKLLIDRAAGIWHDKFRTEDLEDPIDLLENSVFECMLAMLRKAPRTAYTTARLAVQSVEEWETQVLMLFEEDVYSYGDLVHFTGLTLLVRGLYFASLHMLRPDLGTVFDPEFFEHAVTVYEHLADSKYWLLSILLQRVLPHVTSSSTGHNLAPFFRTRAQKRYVQDMLRRRGIIQLWPSQLKAIDQGALDPDLSRTVLTMPTSAGKTLVAESIIARHLLEDPQSRCIYLAPTRALVTEAEYQLRRTFRSLGVDVAKIAMTSVLLTSEVPIAAENRILCLTPEKLDTFLRLENEILDSVSTIVIDEGQLLEDSNRGQLLESAVMKLQVRFPQTKIVFLSAVVPNDEEIADWLGAGIYRSESIRSDWRPTQLHIGEADIEPTPEEVIQNDPMLQAAQNKGKRILRRCVVRYLGGEIIDAFYVRYGSAGKYSSIRSYSVALAKAYESRGSVLVLSTSKPRVEKIAADLTQQCDEINDEQLQKLAAKIEREIDPDFPLADQVRHAVAYHHGDLPPRIRFQIEKAARDNHLRFIASTTTLAEGVNLPVATLIVDDLRFSYQDNRGNWRRRLMSARKFWNLAGRAGRAGSETEGHVILLKPDRYFQSRDEKLSFLNPEIQDLEPLESVSLQLIKTLQTRYRHLLRFDYGIGQFQGVRPIQTMLLALLDLRDTLGLDKDLEEAVEEVLKYSLINYEGAASDVDRSHFKNLVRWGFSIVRTYDELSYEMRRLIVHLGFPISSSVELIEEFQQKPTEELLELLEIRNEGDLLEQKLELLYSAVFNLDELIPPRDQDLPHARIAVEWIKGTRIGEVADQFFEEENRPLARTSNYLYHTQSFNAAWGIGGFVRLIGFLLAERGAVMDQDLDDYEISYLPTYSAYGVGNPVAAHFVVRGIERLDAIFLSRWFYAAYDLEFGSMVDYVESVRWIKSISTDDLRRFLESQRGSFDPDILLVISEMAE